MYSVKGPMTIRAAYRRRNFGPHGSVMGCFPPGPRPSAGDRPVVTGRPCTARGGPHRRTKRTCRPSAGSRPVMAFDDGGRRCVQHQFAHRRGPPLATTRFPF